jgi:CheY-like chemotaxis protein
MLSYRTYRARFKRRVAFVALAVALATAGLSAAHAQRLALDRESERFADLSRILANRASNAWSRDAGGTTLAGLANLPDVSSAAIHDVEGRVRAAYSREGDAFDGAELEWRQPIEVAGEQVGVASVRAVLRVLTFSRAWLNAPSWLAVLTIVAGGAWLAAPRRRAPVANRAAAVESAEANILAALAQSPPAATPGLDVLSPAGLGPNPARRAIRPRADAAVLLAKMSLEGEDAALPARRNLGAGAPPPSPAMAADAPSDAPSDALSNAAAASPARALALESAEAILPSVRVLVVDDAETNRTLMQLALSRAGALVVTAEDGGRAVDKALADPVDVVLLDMQMPVVDGYAAAAKLRELGFTGPIVALASNSLRDDEESCRRVGCDYYFTKPIDPDRLVETVRAALGGKRLARGEATPVTPASEGARNRIYSELSDLSAEARVTIDRFSDGLPQRMKYLRKSLANGEFPRVVQEAQALQAAADRAGFKLVAWAAAPLSLAARDRDSRAATAAMSRLAEIASRVETHDERGARLQV